MLNFNSVSFWYNNEFPPAVYNFNYTMDDKQIVAVVGESGAGKSTLLRIASGLVQDEVNKRPECGYKLSGEVRFNNIHITKPTPVFGYVPQAFKESLLPSLSVSTNIKLALSCSRDEKEKRANDVLSLLELSDICNIKAAMVSGGQMQRVAIGRAIVGRPKILLMDEPYASLDPVLRPKLSSILQSMVELNGVSVLMVTHDVESALAVCNGIIATRRSYGPPEYRTWDNKYVDAKNRLDLKSEIEQWIGQ